MTSLHRARPHAALRAALAAGLASLVLLAVGAASPAHAARAGHAAAAGHARGGEIADSRRAARVRGAAPPALSAAQRRFLVLAEAGVRSAGRWRDRRLGWYDARLHDHDRYPLATIWDIVPLFGAIDAIAIADPSPAHLAAVRRFAAGAERYENRGLRPLPGYSPYPGDRGASTETWFDDNGWWGLGFVEAYRATGARRYLADAQRALKYIAVVGWDRRDGGIWWNTTHPYKAGEALASATLLAALLYERTRSPFALAQARRFLRWANGAGFSAPDGLYAATDSLPTPIDYIEAPLSYAQAVLCRVTGTSGDCVTAERVKETSLRRFGYLLDFAPQYDAIYLQWMLALYALDGDRTLYRMAADNARNAQVRARDASGLYLRTWNGETLTPSQGRPGMLQTHAATVSLFAWLATYAPPPA